MKDNTCGCCEGTESLTPAQIDNRPGLDVLARRIGTHSDFYESMIARLSNLPWDGESPLRRLTTRDPGDPSIALLDAWSTVADVLTFYQERITNEGYLRTATERRSILELSRLVGYKPRPGVAASVHLAFTLDDGAGEIVIPAGTGAKSIPGQNELPQTFETSEDLKARPEWNELKPRLTRPTRITVENALNLRRVFLEGTSLNLLPNDYVIFRIGVTRRAVRRKVESVAEDFERKRTTVELQADVLDPEPFVDEVSRAIRVTVNENPFSPKPTPTLVQEIYNNLANFITDELGPNRPLEELEKEVHELASGTGLGNPQTWSQQLQQAFENLSGAAGKPLTDLRVGLNTALDNQLTGSEAFESNCVAIADEYLELETALAGFETNLATNAPSRDAAREKATEISHAIHKFAARVEADDEIVLTPTAAPMEYDTTSAPAEVDEALHLSRTDDADPSASYSAVVQISANFVPGEDALEFTDTATVKRDAGLSDDQNVMLIPVAAGGATLANFHEALRTVKFRSTGATKKHRRAVSFTIFDNGDAKANGLRTIEIDGDTTGHSLSASFAPLRYQPGMTTEIDDDLAIDDAPAGSSDTYIATIRIEANFVAAEDSLQFTDTADIEHTVVDAQTLQLSVIAGQTVLATEFRDAIRAVKYTNSAASPSSPTRTIMIRLSADLGTGAFEAMAQRDIDIATSDFDDLIAGLTDLRRNIEDKSRTFGKTGPPTIAEFYRDDADSLDNSIKSFRAVTYGSTIDDDVQGILNKLKTDISSKTLLSEQAKVVEAAVPKLQTEETNASGATLPVLADKIRQNREQLEGALTESGTALATQAQTAKTTYDGAADAILTGPIFGGAGTKPGVEFNRFLRDVKDITDTLPDTADGKTLSARATAVEDAIDDLAAAEANAADLQSAFTELTADLRNLRTQLWRLCHAKRKEFKRRILNRIDASLPLFTGAPFDVVGKLTTLRTNVDIVVIGAEPATPTSLPNFGNPLEDLVEPVKTQLKPVESPPGTPTLAKTLEDNAVTLREFAEPLQTVLEEFELSVGQVAGEVPGSVSQQTPTVTPDIAGLLQQFARPSLDAAGRQRLLHDFERAFSSQSDTLAQLQQTLNPSLRGVLYEVWRSLSVELGGPKPEIHVLRKRGAVFGYNAPQKMSPATEVIERLKTDATLALTSAQKVAIGNLLKDSALVILEEPTVNTTDNPYPERDGTLYLDNAFEQILPESLIVIERADEDPKARTVDLVETHPRTAYGISGTTTELTLSEGWWTPAADSFDVIRSTAVYVDSEELKFAEEPIRNDVLAGSTLELDDLLDGIDAGRVLILSGERSDIAARGIKATELIEVVGVEQSIELDRPGDRIRTRLSLAETLKHSYFRETVTIRGNVIAATQGETQNEVLGSGDAKLAFQRFSLSSSPLTFLSAPTAAGAESTLTVHVNNVRWDGTDGFAGRQPTDRIYVTTTNKDDHTTITFGNGEYGARLPTGVENVTAVYRLGFGRSGNVNAGQISQLAAKPLGVKEVVNPIQASGGADRETRDRARRNAPVAVVALDRLVSVQDYADLSRTFAGIGKASASRLSDTRRSLLHVTVAGTDDIPIEPDSELFANLLQALTRNADPQFPVSLSVRELALLVIDAGVRILPEYEWEDVERRIRAAVLERLSFDRRELGQDVTRSEVIETIQRIPGVGFVDINILDSIPETIAAEELSGLACRLALNPRVTASLAGTLKTFRRRINFECTVARFIAAYAIEPIVDPDNSANDKTALQVLQELNLGVLDRIEKGPVEDPDSDINKTFEKLTQEPGTDQKPKLVREEIEILTVRRREYGIHAAQLAYLSPAVPDTLLLSEIL